MPQPSPCRQISLDMALATSYVETTVAEKQDFHRGAISRIQGTLADFCLASDLDGLVSGRLRQTLGNSHVLPRDEAGTDRCESGHPGRQDGELVHVTLKPVPHGALT